MASKITRIQEQILLMVAYVVTGKLGSGKSLICVGKIRDALSDGRKVATNLELNLSGMYSKYSKATYYRIPDRPTIHDLLAIGNGNPTYDESKNGALVLDECATWFDSRSWNDKSRKEVIDWFLHARKLGWDLYFIVQDVEMLDSHARKALAELVVFCKRLDRMKIPFLGSVVKMVTGSALKFPKIHRAKVRYGMTEQSIECDTWTYTGSDLYRAYDTKQIFADDYPHATYSALPPINYNYLQKSANTWANKMRLTKIYFRRFSVPIAISCGVLIGCAASVLYFGKSKIDSQKPAIETKINSPSSSLPVVPTVDNLSRFRAFVQNLRIAGTSRVNGFLVYELTDAPLNSEVPAFTTLTSNDLATMGASVKMRSDCRLDVTIGTETTPIYCLKL